MPILVAAAWLQWPWESLWPKRPRCSPWGQVLQLLLFITLAKISMSCSFSPFWLITCPFAVVELRTVSIFKTFFSWSNSNFGQQIPHMCESISNVIDIFLFFWDDFGSIPTSQKRRGIFALVITIRRRSGNSSSISLAWTLVTWVSSQSTRRLVGKYVTYLWLFGSPLPPKIESIWIHMAGLLLTHPQVWIDMKWHSQWQRRKIKTIILTGLSNTT